MGYETLWQPTLAAALSSLQHFAPALVCSESKLANAGWRELLEPIKRSSAELVLITNFMTPVCAFEALRQGCDLVLSKPAFARDVLGGLGHSTDVVAPSLEAAKKLYLAYAVTECGSLAEASRELAVERSSLRRMLAKAGERFSTSYRSTSRQVDRRPRLVARQ